MKPSNAHCQARSLYGPSPCGLSYRYEGGSLAKRPCPTCGARLVRDGARPKEGLPWLADEEERILAALERTRLRRLAQAEEEGR